MEKIKHQDVKTVKNLDDFLGTKNVTKAKIEQAEANVEKQKAEMLNEPMGTGPFGPEIAKQPVHADISQPLKKTEVKHDMRDRTPVEPLTQRQAESLFVNPAKKEIAKKEASKQLAFEGEPQNKEDMFKFATYLGKNHLLPATIDTQAKTVIALHAARSLGAKDFGTMSLYLKSFYFIKNSIQMFGDLPLSLVRKSGKLEYLDEFFIDKEYQRISIDNKNLDARPAACCVTLRRKGEPTPRQFVLTREDLLVSGISEDKHGNFIYGKSGTWTRYGKIHWIRRTRGWALKSVFPDILNNAEVFEYSADYVDKPSQSDEALKKVND